MKRNKKLRQSIIDYPPILRTLLGTSAFVVGFLLTSMIMVSKQRKGLMIIKIIQVIVLIISL